MLHILTEGQATFCCCWKCCSKCLEIGKSQLVIINGSSIQMHLDKHTVEQSVLIATLQLISGFKLMNLPSHL